MPALSPLIFYTVKSLIASFLASGSQIIVPITSNLPKKAHQIYLCTLYDLVYIISEYLSIAVIIIMVFSRNRSRVFVLFFVLVCIYAIISKQIFWAVILT